MRRAALIVALLPSPASPCAALRRGGRARRRARSSRRRAARRSRQADRYVVVRRDDEVAAARQPHADALRPLPARTARVASERVRVEAPDLGIWHRAEPRRRRPSSSASACRDCPRRRATAPLISFRWTGPTGAKGKRTVVVKTSHPGVLAARPAARPARRVRLASQPAGAGLADYTLRVRNAGKTAAGGFAVALAVARRTQTAVRRRRSPPAATPWSPYARRAAAPTRRRPRRSTPTARVAESDEGNNTATRTCMVSAPADAPAALPPATPPLHWMKR